jgi:hypothetical protein
MIRKTVIIIALGTIALNLGACQSVRSLSDRMESKYSLKKRKTYISCVLPPGIVACRIPVRVSEQSFNDMLMTIDESKGTPYRFGGNNPGGFDCSGFVQYLYSRSFQMLLPRNSGEIAMLGEIVPRERLKPGDLLFFSNGGYQIDHVGIFIGSDSFAHSASNRGITVSSLRERYYLEHYAFASRIITVD